MITSDTKPVHRAAGAGNPAGSKGAKSKRDAVDMDIHSRFVFSLRGPLAPR